MAVLVGVVANAVMIALVWPRLLSPWWLLSGYLAPVRGVMRAQHEGQQHSEVQGC